MTDPSNDTIMNIADNASLTFFTNPLYLSILERKKLCNIKDNTEEIKFYRKRIVSLFKDMLKEPSESINTEIKELHTLFTRAAIRYFEVTDKKDIIQGQHQYVEAKDKEDTITELGSIDEANDIMMRKTLTVASLDNYVIVKQENPTNEIRIIPMKMDINLKTNDLKVKGVPPKKIKK